VSKAKAVLAEDPFGMFWRDEAKAKPFVGPARSVKFGFPTENGKFKVKSALGFIDGSKEPH